MSFFRRRLRPLLVRRPVLALAARRRFLRRRF
jgi:hypothetical protein